jgi:hypothetical protein
MSKSRRLYEARIVEVNTPGAPTLYRVETLRTPQQRGYGLAAACTTFGDAEEVLAELVADHLSAASERVVREWRA